MEAFTLKGDGTGDATLVGTMTASGFTGDLFITLDGSTNSDFNVLLADGTGSAQTVSGNNKLVHNPSTGVTTATKLTVSTAGSFSLSDGAVTATAAELNYLDMICFQVSSAPALCDTFSYDGDEYQLISVPKDAGVQGGLLKAKARYTNATICIEKDFYFEVSAK